MKDDQTDGNVDDMGALSSLKRGLRMLVRRGERVSEARFKTAIEQSPLGVHVFAPDGRPLLSNTAWKRLWGFKEEETEESSILRDEKVRASGLVPYLEKSIAGESAVTPPLTSGLSANGDRTASPRWFEAYVYPVRDEGGRVLEVVLMAEDITERQKVIADLEKSEERFGFLVEHSSDLVMVIETGGKIKYVSPSVSRVLGHSSEDLIGEDLFDYLHMEDLGMVGPAFTGGFGTLGATGDRVEYRFRHKDGTYRTLEGVATNLIDNPSIEGIVINARDITERKALEDQISQQAFYDSLTGLPNRVLFVEHLYQALARLTRQDKPFAVLLMDIDNFRVVNDSMGPETGDAVLAGFADRLREQVRPQDTIARFGEDEFAILLEGLDDLGGAVRVAERVSQTLIESPFVIVGRSVYVGVSIGVVLGARSLEEPREVLQKADLALRRAKRKGKGRFEIFDQSMDADALSRLQMEDELRAALAREEFVLHYQPIVAIATEKTTSVEALVRWDHPKRGLLEAGEFMEVAEETGIIVQIDDMVLRRACNQAALWQEKYRRPPMVNLNLSRGQLSRPDLAEKVAEVLEHSGLRASGLAFEVSEDTLAEDDEGIVTGLRALKDLGCRVTVDKFGAGRTPLAHLKRFPTDALKMDLDLISAVDRDLEDRALVSAVISFARALGRVVVACGVERAAQVQTLRDLGCDLAQGDYFSRALPGEIATSLLDAELAPRISTSEAGTPEGKQE